MALFECTRKPNASRLFRPNFIHKEKTGTELSHNMSAKIPKNRVFFHYFSSLNKVNLKFKETPQFENANS